MFVMMADIHLKEGAEADFVAWFSESNKVLHTAPGFISRRCLKSSDGNYRIIVEHESLETFVRMHKSAEHEKVHPLGRSFMSAEPQRIKFTVLAE